MTSCLFWPGRNSYQWGQLLKERICSWRSKFFPLRVDPTEKGSKNENGRVAAAESVLNHLADRLNLLPLPSMNAFDQYFCIINFIHVICSTGFMIFLIG